VSLTVFYFPLLNLLIEVFSEIIFESQKSPLITIRGYGIKRKIYSVYHFHARFSCFSYIKLKLIVRRMIPLLPTNFSSLGVELYMLCASLGLVFLCWIFLFVKALRSHVNTPVIKNGSILVDNKHRFTRPFVSVIVPARNEEDNIERCLLSVLTQDYSNFEVIAVDDNSQDRTLEIMKNIKSKREFGKKLNVISLSAKPDGWTGKTWASQQGYINSSGDVLLFTDADSLFESKYVIELAVKQMLSDKLDALTGVPYLPLIDFWSKVVMPVWNLYSEIFDHGISDANDPESRVAFVMGSFFMIKKEVFEKIGAYKSVRDEIQEDRAIGNLLKRSHYKLKMYKVDSLVSALWSRDASSLWHGIRRSVMPTAAEDKLAIISHQVILFAMIALPFLLLPYTAAMLYVHADYSPSLSIVGKAIPNPDRTPPHAPSTGQQHIQNSLFKHQVIVGLEPENKEVESYLEISLFWSNVSLCFLIVAVTGIKGFMKYRLVPLYSFLCIIGGSFLIASYAYSTLPLLTGLKIKSIEWRGRSHDVIIQCNEKSKTA
jgi:chlorobactene glucosyltransferase